ncbi:MAG TPA: AMP-dependent synthetase [Deltaproteobacteria bacterium]|nr:AMP-dependent synthetase [Deltaproteobacteria bacterium]
MENIYLQKPWLKFYPPGVYPEIDIPTKSVNELFDEGVEKWGKKVSINFYGGKITYQELKEKIDRFATALYDLGLRKGDRVGILLLNSPEHIIALFAVLKVGAIITPINPMYVSSEIKHQIENSGSETLICQDILYEALEKAGLKFKNVILSNISESLPKIKKFIGKSILKGVYEKMSTPSYNIFKREGFYQFQELINKWPPNPPKVEINPKEDIAFLPYTGGTTGLPKGVMLTHYNVVANIFLLNAFYYQLEEGKESVVAYMPFSHASGQVLTVMRGIPFGHTLGVVTNPDPEDIINVGVMNKVTWFIGAPSLFEILKDYEKTNILNWKKLKIIYCGADALHEATAKDWIRRTGSVLTEMYGMTETTAITHANPVGREKIGSIGIPIPNTLACILDPEEDKYVPQGENGELCVSGPQVTKGYWDNPKATAECETIIDGIRWWRTGDLGHMDEEGYFYIYDRKRDLIKYKGYRIFAREVEEVIKTHPKVKDVGVIGVPDIKVGEIPKAYVVLESDARGKVSETEIMEHCKEKLSYYKIPRIVQFVGEIPKTDVGKVSRRELREQEI